MRSCDGADRLEAVVVDSRYFKVFFGLYTGAGSGAPVVSAENKKAPRGELKGQLWGCGSGGELEELKGGEVCHYF